MARQEAQPPIDPKDSIYTNSLFLVQVDYYDGNFLQNKQVPSPFPREYTDQELTDWLAKMNQDFNEQVIRETLYKL